jgi:hypothetical protein
MRMDSAEEVVGGVQAAGLEIGELVVAKAGSLLRLDAQLVALGDEVSSQHRLMGRKCMLDTELYSVLRAPLPVGHFEPWP